MNIFTFYPNTGIDHLSVEVDGDELLPNIYPSCSIVSSDYNSRLEVNCFENELKSAGYCQSSDLLKSIGTFDGSDDLEKYFDVTLAEENLALAFDPELSFDNIFSTDVDDPVDQNKKVESNKKPISLSQSVGVGVPQRLATSSRKIEIVHALEETFRSRYKSDYFGQNGANRKPRYVADCAGNHYITLKVPVGIRGKIRVDWLTVPQKDGTRYVMPYRFQEDNDSADTPDKNPLYVDINTDASGIMKVYLVLIKAKQDALKSLQPLQPYHPLKDIFGVIDKSTAEKRTKLTPKKLIENFQLFKSQLAFTLCTLNADGQSHTTEWTSSVLSTVLEEITGDPSLTKIVCCPNCAFSINVADDSVPDQEMDRKNKRKSVQLKTAKPASIKKQRSAPERMYSFD